MQHPAGTLLRFCLNCLHICYITEERGFRLDEHHSECRTFQNTHYSNEHTHYTKIITLRLNALKLLFLITFEKATHVIF